MKTLNWTIFGCGLFLVLSIWPGRIEVAIVSLCLFFIWIPILFFWSLLIIVKSCSELIRLNDPDRPKLDGIQSSLVILFTIILIYFQVPCLIVFACYSQQFRELAEKAPQDPLVKHQLDKRIGPYYIDYYGSYPAGSVYFRSQSGPDGIGPDEMSYGFAYRPKGKWCTFGKTRYQQKHLFGNWYSFSVSSD